MHIKYIIHNNLTNIENVFTTLTVLEKYYIYFMIECRVSMFLIGSNAWILWLIAMHNILLYKSALI